MTETAEHHLQTRGSSKNSTFWLMKVYSMTGVPATAMLPFTSSVAAGEFVPIPMLPTGLITNLKLAGSSVALTMPKRPAPAVLLLPLLRIRQFLAFAFVF